MTPDEAIRSRLHEDAVRTGWTTPASVVFVELGPRMRHARRMRRIVIGTTAVVLIAAMAAVLQLSVGTRSASLRTYGDNERGAAVGEPAPGRYGTNAPRNDAGRDDRGDPDRMRPTTPEASVATASTTEATTSTSAQAPASPGIGVPAAPIPGPPPVQATEPPVPVTDPTIVTPTSVVADTQAPTITTHQIDSACGSIVVETVEDRVDLVEVMANPDYTSDVESDGPEAVTVGLHGGDDACELRARVVDGQIVTNVDGPDERESEEHADGFEAPASPVFRSEAFVAEGYRSGDYRTRADGSDEDRSDED